MLILALDTTTSGGSVALALDGLLLESLAGDPAISHGQRLPAEIVTVLARQRKQVADIELYGVAVGPGSFTGLRIGIATVQGLALVSRRPVVGVTTLEALAVAAAWTEPAIAPGHLVAVWLDAQRGEVFSSFFRAVAAPQPSGFRYRLDPAGEARVESPEESVERLGPLAVVSPTWLVGDGAIRYRDRAARLSLAGILAPPPLAPSIAQVAFDRAAAGGSTTPHAIRPVYVRRPDAELARERRAAEAVGKP
jgi:tRNA threonylcarbamoyladenosine biosynthesis protein TsaB